MMENNLLLMIEHPLRGIWYFTNVSRAAKWIGILRPQLDQCLGKKKPGYKDYKFQWVDGSNIIYKYIDPVK